MERRITAGEKILVRGNLVLVRAPLIHVTSTLIVIRPRLILITDDLITIGPGLVFITGQYDVDRLKSREEVGATGGAVRDLGLLTASGTCHVIAHSPASFLKKSFNCDSTPKNALDIPKNWIKWVACGLEFPQSRKRNGWLNRLPACTPSPGSSGRIRGIGLLTRDAARRFLDVALGIDSRRDRP